MSILKILKRKAKKLLGKKTSIVRMEPVRRRARKKRDTYWENLAQRAENKSRRGTDIVQDDLLSVRRKVRGLFR
jgi:hypothetical protein